jgi:NDP-sugar pyrophosphorylase family protein
LAAGANTRLEGILPPGLKPLLVVNGRTLFKHAVDHAHDAWGTERVVAVVSPDNVRPLTQVGGADDWVVQPQADGVMDALRRGLRAVDTRWTLVLCADNTFDLDYETNLDLLRLRGRVPLFGARGLDEKDARRFTRYVRHGDNVRFLEASGDEPGTGCWIGPLCLPTEGLRNGQNSPTIVGCVNVAAHGLMLTPLDMNCADLGIPEAL